MDLPIQPAHRFSVILGIPSSLPEALAKQAGVPVPPVLNSDGLPRKALVERCVAAVLREINSMMDPIGTELIVMEGGEFGDSLRSIFGDEISRGKLVVVTATSGKFDIGSLWNQGALKARGAWLSFIRESDEWRSGHITELSAHLKAAHVVLGTNPLRLPSDPLHVPVHPLSDPLLALLNGTARLGNWSFAAGAIRQELFEEQRGFHLGRTFLLPEWAFILKTIVSLKKRGQLDLLHFYECNTIRNGILPSGVSNTIQELREIASVLFSLGELPIRFWPLFFRRAGRFLMNH